MAKRTKAPESRGHKAQVTEAGDTEFARQVVALRVRGYSYAQIAAKLEEPQAVALHGFPKVSRDRVRRAYNDAMDQIRAELRKQNPITEALASLQEIKRKAWEILDKGDFSERFITANVDEKGRPILTDRKDGQLSIGRQTIKRKAYDLKVLELLLEVERDKRILLGYTDPQGELTANETQVITISPHYGHLAESHEPADAAD